jgi:cytosine/adenosine deaminase-related metal-dependent hydrolase
MLEDEVGSIEVGKRADFVLFSIDLLDLASPEFLLTNEIELGGLDKFVITTVTGGWVVYQRSKVDTG